MRHKIESKVNNCTECKHSKEFQDMHSNCDFVLVCCYEEEDGTKGKSILLDRSHNRIKSNKDVDIPKDCPLEDYNSNLEKTEIINYLQTLVNLLEKSELAYKPTFKEQYSKAISLIDKILEK